LVLIPLLLLGGLEVALRLIGYGYPTHFFLTTRLNGREVVHENQQFGWRFFPAAAARTPRPVVLPRNKPPQTCRIFVFGESAAYGDPAPAFGLPRVLEVLLQSRYPAVQFEVVNVAMTAINSHVILPIAKDCARQDGDVWVVYMGNNEVVGPYGAGTIFGPQVPSRTFIRASHSLNASKIGQLLAGVRESAQRQKSAPLTSVGLELFLDNKLRRDDPQMETVYAHFARNLSDILKTGTDSGAKVVVSTMASNLKDCAPFASLHRPGLSDTETADWEQHYQAGISAEQAGNFAAAKRAYDAAAKIDDQWADLRFRQARLLWKLGGFTAALQHFTLARDLDALRFRADTRINDLIRQIGTNRLSEGIAFLDGHEVLAQLSPHGVLGSETLYEHVHLNFTGNYHLALALAEQITEVLKPAVLAGQVPASGAWLSAAECAIQLDLNDWDHQRTWELLQQRLAGLPFTLQLDHAAQSARIQSEIARYQQKLAGQSIEDRAQRCQQALVARPDDWTLHQKLAQLLAPSPAPILQGRAIEAWRQVIALVPHYPEAYYELGVLLDKAGQPHEAETQLRQSLKLKQNYHPNALHALGNLLAGQNRLPEAVAAYEKALQLKPNMPDTVVNLGVALKRLGRIAEARARFEAALPMPGNHAAAANLGQLLNESGEISAAIAVYTEMLRANPKDATAHYNLGRCLGLLDRSSEAQEHYVQALRLRPEMDEAHTQLALELARSGNETAALEHFREAVRLKPDSGEAHKNLGIALARQRRFAEAIKEFEAALRLDPGDTAAQNFLQAARRSLGSH
jgi:tetratricopeptide (TPR) repeat protein